jgi:hypothetical protein
MNFSRKYFLIVAILLIILTTNVIIQPIYSQESDENESDNTSDKNDLLASMKPLENNVGKGDDVKFVITVTDSNSQPVTDAKIYGSMTYTDGIHKHTFEGKTDENGKLFFLFATDKKLSLGELNSEIKVTKNNYDPLSLSGAFSVVKASDSSGEEDSDNDDEDNDIQYSITGTLEDRGVYNFAFAGDYDCDDTTRDTISAMKKKNPNLVLALGDLSETNDPDCFFEMVKSLDEKGKLKIALGFHDMHDGDDSSSRYSQYLSHFDMADPFYSFDYKNIHFLVMTTGLDTVVPYGEDSSQYEFVKSDLAQASINEKIDWIIVSGYRPFFTSPSAHPGQQTLRDLYPELFEKYGVDLVITAHNHNYQRTYPIVSDSKHSNNPEIKDRDSNNYDNPGAPIYLIVGTAGSELHEFFGQASFVATQLMESGFLDVDILKGNTQLKGKFIDAESNSGKDIFTINKS